MHTIWFYLNLLKNPSQCKPVYIDRKKSSGCLGKEVGNRKDSWAELQTGTRRLWEVMNTLTILITVKGTK